MIIVFTHVVRPSTFQKNAAGGTVSLAEGIIDNTRLVIYLSLLRWLHEIDQNCEVVNRVLVGNKNDDPDRKVVLTEDARSFANQMGIQLFETSAKENINVEEMFRAITDLVLRSKKLRVGQERGAGGPEGGNIRVGGGRRPGQKPSKKSGCCK